MTTTDHAADSVAGTDGSIHEVESDAAMSEHVRVVRGERVYTPREKYVLPGVSRRTVMDLAAQLGLACEERDLDVYDAASWSVVTPLSERSVAKRGRPMDFPDFTSGGWKTPRPLHVMEVT